MSKKKCPYFKAECIENECGIWDEGLGVCSMVSIALGNWSIRSMRVNRKKLKATHPTLHKYRPIITCVGLVVATLATWAVSLTRYKADEDASSLILTPMLTGMFWYWVIKGFFDDESLGE